MIFARTLMLMFLSVLFCSEAYSQSKTPAKELFGRKSKPSQQSGQAIGSYSKGCLAGGTALPIDGPYHQAMRLSRNRNWGHPVLVSYLNRLSASVVKNTNWPGLLIGDLAQPRGGPMLTGHRSHQIGLDADIWLMPSPPRRYTRRERENVSAQSVLLANKKAVDPTIWTADHTKVLKIAASDPKVARIFVHPAIKKALCTSAKGDRRWLRTIRPWYGHHYHFHVRMSCPPGSNQCKNQNPPPAGDGCGKELAWWLSDEPYKPSDKPAKKRFPVVLSDLPRSCQTVLSSN